MVLTREEKEKIVLELHGQGKGTREIAKEVRISFSQISAILKKGLNRESLGKSGRKKHLYQRRLTLYFPKVRLRWK